MRSKLSRYLRHIIYFFIIYDCVYSETKSNFQEQLIIYLVQNERYIDLSHLQTETTQALLVTWLEPPPRRQDAYTIYMPNSTWAERRNALYREMFGLFGIAETLSVHPFSYIVMMDGDVNLTYRNASKTHAFRSFERYLMKHMPAVGVPCNTAQRSETAPEVQGVWKFDQRVIAFHLAAAPLYLPYPLVFPEDSREFCGEVHSALCAVAYPEKCVQFNDVCFNSGGSKSSRSASEGYDWIAPAALHLVDYLNILRLKDCDSTKVFNLSNATATVETTVVQTKDGLFDPCHPFFEDKLLFHCHTTALRTSICLLRPEVYFFNGLTTCAGSGTVFDQRLKERQYLFLQEVAFRLKDLSYWLTAPQAEQEPAMHASSRSHRIKVDMLYPVNHSCVSIDSEEDWVTLQLDVHHSLAWRPELSPWEFRVLVSVEGAGGGGGMQPDEYSVSLRPPPCSSAVGMPPVHWFRSSRGAASNRIKLSVPGIRPGVTAVTVNFRASAPKPDQRLHVWQYMPEDDRVDVVDVQLNSAFTAAVRNRSCAGAAPSRVQSQPSLDDDFRMVYLVQHDACMDLSHLKTAHSEVLLLTWQTPPGDDCPGAVYLPRSTLVQGRNRLYREMLQRYADGSPAGHPFTYIVIMDGDSRLVEAADFGQNTGHAWRTFESYLHLYRPAVGVPHFGECDYEAGVEVQLVFNFDQIVVAYHAEAAALLLPYVELFDNVSWWYCGTVQNALCAAAYNEHRMQFNALKALSFVSATPGGGGGGGGGESGYKRGSSFGQALRWIATSFATLEAVLRIPWPNVFQSAVMSDHPERDAQQSPFPRTKGDRNYGEGLADIFDFCHEYFVWKSDPRFPCVGGASRRTGHEQIRDHIDSLRAQLTSLRPRVIGLSALSGDVAVEQQQPSVAMLTSGSPCSSAVCEYLKIELMISLWDAEMARQSETASQSDILSPKAGEKDCAPFTHPQSLRRSVLDLGAFPVSSLSPKARGDAVEASVGMDNRDDVGTASALGFQCSLLKPLNLSTLVLSSELELLDSFAGFTVQCHGDFNSSTLSSGCRVEVQFKGLQTRVGDCEVELLGSPGLLNIHFDITSVNPGLNEMAIQFKLGPWESSEVSVLVLAKHLETREGECVPQVTIEQQKVYRLPSLQYVSSLHNRLVTTHSIHLRPLVAGCPDDTGEVEVKLFSCQSSAGDAYLDDSEANLLLAVSHAPHEAAVALSFADYGAHLVEVNVLSADGSYRLLAASLLVLVLQPTQDKRDFCYLIQASEHVDTEHLRGPSSEVIQLVWRNWEEHWADDRTIFFPNSSWTEGRNRLFREVAARYPATEFRYLIFMDDDAELVHWGDFGRGAGDAWRTFERYLLHWEPAVGVPSYRDCLYRRADKEVQSIFAFDQIVVAYHWEAWPLLLPYTQVFDRQSWWYTSTVQHALCHVFYPNSTVMFNAVEAVNAQHRYGGDYRRQRSFEVPLAWIATAFLHLDHLLSLPLHDPTRTAGAGTPAARRAAGGRDYFTYNPTVDMAALPPRPAAAGGGAAGAAARVAYDVKHPYFADRALLHPGGAPPAAAAAAARGGCVPAERVMGYLADMARRVQALERAVLERDGA